MSEIKKEDELNKNAKVYIPTKNRVPKIIDFTLTAQEYRPKHIIEYIEADEDEDNEVQEKMDMIVKDMVEEEIIEQMGNEESEDEDKWFPKYKDCDCCQGFVFKCKGETCMHEIINYLEKYINYLNEREKTIENKEKEIEKLNSKIEKLNQEKEIIGLAINGDVSKIKLLKKLGITGKNLEPDPGVLQIHPESKNLLTIK